MNAAARKPPRAELRLSDISSCWERAWKGRGAASAAPDWLQRLREDAWARFEAQGFPSTRDELWRYTPVTAIARADLELPADEPLDERVRKAVREQVHGAQAALRLVFVNGRLDEQLSTRAAAPAGLQLLSLAVDREAQAERLRHHLGHYATADNHSFTALNTALSDDGALVLLADGAVIDQPLYVLYVSHTQGRSLMTHPRLLVLSGRSSQLRLVEVHARLDSGTSFSNGVSELVLGQDSSLEHYRFNCEPDDSLHVGRVQVVQQRASRFSGTSLALGGGLVRNDIGVTLEGEGAECVLDGLYVVGGRQHVDHHTRIDHLTPHGSSQELYKGILDGHSTAVFDGTIYVAPDAQKTSSAQTNRNLLLSDDAEINTKPLLEINADDVKCAHGSTVGQLDTAALFYLRSRGIGLQQARELLVHAFARDVVDRVRVPQLRDELGERLSRALPGLDPGGSR